MKKLSLIILLSAALTALSFSQGRGGGMFQMEPKQIQYGLVRFDDVKTELKLTDDQRSKIDAANMAMQSAMREAFPMFQSDRDGAMAAMKKAGDTWMTAVEGTLNDDQKKRLHELYLQKQGASALTDPEVQKALKLTDDQIAQIKGLQDKANAANTSLREKMQNGELDRSEIGPLMQKNAETLKSGMEKIMTDSQKEQFKTMQGTPFTFSADDNGFGFGRGGRGGGGGGGGN